MNSPIRPVGMISLIASSGGDERRTASFPNVITNSGLNHIFSCPKYNGIGYYMGECQVGRDGTWPTEKDTQLGNFVASSNPVGGVDATPARSLKYDGDTPYWSCYYRYHFPVGAITGFVREIGIAPYHTSPIDLFSRARVRDHLYKPTEFIVLSDESLDVVYELRVYLDVRDITYKVNLNQEKEIKCTMRACEIGNIPALGQDIESGGAEISIYSGPIEGVVFTPSGESETNTNIDFFDTDLVDNSTLTKTKFPTNDAIWDNGVRSMSTRTNFQSLQVEFDPPLGKTDSEKLRLQFKYNWGRQ